MARRLPPYADLAPKGTFDFVADVLAKLPLLALEHRRGLGLSQRAAAAQIGISFSTLSRLERGCDLHLSNAVAVLRWLDGGGT